MRQILPVSAPGGTGRAVTLPEPFAGWFARRGWAPHPHQLTLLDRAEAASTLLIAPTGGGKTLAGFLPSLLALGAAPAPGLHTIYVSPLKALAADIRRNLTAPLAEMGLAIRVEDRTGDTGQAARARQRVDPPHILLTTPESLALMLSYEEAPRIFGSVASIAISGSGPGSASTIPVPAPSQAASAGGSSTVAESPTRRIPGASPCSRARQSMSWSPRFDSASAWISSTITRATEPKMRGASS